VVWQVVVVPTEQGSNPGIAPKKKKPRCARWLVAVCRRPRLRCMRRPGLRILPAQVRFGPMGMGQGSGGCLGRGHTVPSLLN